MNGAFPLTGTQSVNLKSLTVLVEPVHLLSCQKCFFFSQRVVKLQLFGCKDGSPEAKHEPELESADPVEEAFLLHDGHILSYNCNTHERHILLRWRKHDRNILSTLQLEQLGTTCITLKCMQVAHVLHCILCILKHQIAKYYCPMKYNSTSNSSSIFKILRTNVATHNIYYANIPK